MDKVYQVYVYYGAKMVRSQLWTIHKTEAGAKKEKAKRKESDAYIMTYYLHE